MDRNLFRELGHLVHPLTVRLANIIVRGEVHLVDDANGRQQLQIEDLETGAVLDEAPHFQPFGFSSVPFGGASVIAVCDGGDHGRAYVVAVSDARHRPKGGEPGEVTVYNHTGAKIRITKDGDIELTPAPGREVLVRSEGGDAGELATKADLQLLRDAITSLPGGAAVVTALDAAVATNAPPPSTTPAQWPSGTTVLKAE